MITKKLKSKKMLLAGGAVVALAAVFMILELTGTTHVFRKEKVDTPSSANDQTINYGPATEQEKQESEARKNDIGQQPSPTPPSPSGKKQVVPVVVSADKEGANAYVSGIFEEGGTCTAKFTTTNGDSIEATSSGFQNSNYTSCAPIKLNGPLNIKGDWTVVVSYSSATAEGSSQPRQFKVE